jgi:long-chain acyl-CoA synthetase
MPALQTVGELLESSCKRVPSCTAMQMKTPEGKYRRITFAEAWETAGNLASFLAGLGVKPGDRVAVQGENRPEWGISWIASMRAGAVTVPIDALMGFKEVSFILGHSETSVALVSRNIFNKTWKDNLASLADGMRIIVFDPVESTDPRIMILAESISRGKDQNIPLPPPSGPDSLLEILYTSGTTGNPKAVMLTNRNIASDIIAIRRMFTFDENDVFLSVLPIHHVFEGTVGFLTPLCTGAAITYAESLKSASLIANMRETGATIMLGVPLLYEKLYYGILRAVGKRPLAVRVPFHCMLAAAKIAGRLGWRPGTVLFRGLREKAGMGTMRLLISGGGPLPLSIGRGFLELGFTMIQGYGLSETSPVITASTEAHNNVRAAGLPLDGAEIRINGADARGVGEIMVRGPMVMKGYYRNEEATRAVMEGGWMHTGDAGFIDSRGFIHITGRIKNVIVTHGGKNVYPEELEEMLDASPFIRESMVYGEPVSEDVRGENVKALVVPDYELIREEWATLPHGHFHHEPSPEAIRHEVDRAVQQVNHHLPPFKRIVEWKIRDEELEKTSTRKIKRFLYKNRKP